tara:strand:+ start:168 stop:812 length:645 start_codon:yes stop_codon:yes gene_type:complete
MNTKYFILGSGGFAKEVFFLCEECLDKSNQFMGFIDNEIKKNKITVRGKKYSVLNENDFIKNTKPSKEINLYMGIGNPKLISKISKKFIDFIFPNLIHPNVIFDKLSVELGRGNIITAGCIFTVDIKIGSFNVFNLCTTIGHDVFINDFNVFNPSTNISGKTTIGSRNLFGTNSTVLQMLKIGNDNLIGASALINKCVDHDSIMVGVPAKNIKS